MGKASYARRDSNPPDQSTVSKFQTTTSPLHTGTPSPRVAHTRANSSLAELKTLRRVTPALASSDFKALLRLANIRRCRAIPLIRAPSANPNPPHNSQDQSPCLLLLLYVADCHHHLRTSRVAGAKRAGRPWFCAGDRARVSRVAGEHRDTPGAQCTVGQESLCAGKCVWCTMK